jgi:hypothetical protein
MTPKDNRWANEDLHREGKPHLRKLWGIVLCRLCKEEKVERTNF